MANQRWSREVSSALCLFSGITTSILISAAIFVYTIVGSLVFFHRNLEHADVYPSGLAPIVIDWYTGKRQYIRSIESWTKRKKTKTNMYCCCTVCAHVSTTVVYIFSSFRRKFLLQKTCHYNNSHRFFLQYCTRASADFVVYRDIRTRIYGCCDRNYFLIRHEKPFFFHYATRGNTYQKSMRNIT